MLWPSELCREKSRWREETEAQTEGRQDNAVQRPMERKVSREDSATADLT